MDFDSLVNSDRETVIQELRFVAKRTSYTRAVLLPAFALPPLFLVCVVWKFGWDVLRDHGLTIVLSLLAALALYFFVESAKRRYEGDVIFSRQGLGIATPSFRGVIPWQRISRVYLFKEDVHVEGPSIGRVQVSLEGHDDHKDQLLAAFRETGRSMNLTWVESLANGLDSLR
ncbi:MAG: hypothetical protein KC492_10980 [Myxococcales bacterium]|nr:hypothetical protein [Myxococcales bacterium]